MEAVRNVDLQSLLDTFISLSAAFVLGGIIGLERQYRQRTAGLRTNVLVAVGAAVFVDLANRLNGRDAAVHVLAYVVSGIGFLGAGVIMREEGNVRGLNTAATLWCAAGVGAAAGADLILEAVLATLFVLGANTLLRPAVNALNRRPLDVDSAEVTNTVYVIAQRGERKSIVEQIEHHLARCSYPARNLEVHPFGADEIEIAATLAATSIDGAELDAVVGQLAAIPAVRQVFWSPSTSE
ncbi:MgtC/SapB family protein [Massilia putida]|uniref:MgtC/SapB family protein n=1 Tax=Massilia putida TaxID=1141883 RepID=UPI0009531111|nr:MgtC/SapB family protein [Massilia putida]